MFRRALCRPPRKRFLYGWFAPVALFAWSALQTTVASPPGPGEAKGKQPPASPGPVLEVAGRTQCVFGRKGLIAPVPLHPVVEVLVKPGDRVRKGQPLVKLDDDEPQADVRAKKAALESARISLKEARRYRAAAEKAYAGGALPEVNYFAALTTALKVEQDERAAAEALASSQAELEHYLVTAPIDGVVCSLDVHPGMVSRPGTTVWGEILDLSEIDVRCELTPDQADRVAVGQEAEVRANGKNRSLAVGRLAFIGISADKATGLVPVLVRIANPKGHLRCEVPVVVRFIDAAPANLER